MNAVPGRSESHVLAERLVAAHRRLQAHVATLALNKVARPGRSGEWSAGEVLAHIPEFLRYWCGQVQLLTDRPGAGFGRSKDDADRIAWVSERGQLPLGILVGDLSRAMDEVVAIVSSLSDDDLQKSGEHFRRGRMTVGDVVETFLVQHLDEHQLQLRDVVADLQDQATLHG
jgi:uncharacterized damage-inducible protein DinB